MQHRFFRSNKSVALVAAVLGAAVVAAVGLAGPWTTTVQTDSKPAVLRVVNTYAGGFDSGWHYHSGIAIVQVMKGSLVITEGYDCKPKTVSAGDTSIEIPYVPVRAVGVGEIQWTTTFVLANGEPTTVPVSTSPCP
jgi:hypothetical protein